MADGPLGAYRALLAAGSLRDDAAQRLAIEKLQLLHTRLRGYRPETPRRVGLGLFGWGRESIEQKSIPGLYLYGGVGRGKSMLMDLFFAGAPVEPKRRVHFHAFMQEVHGAIFEERKKHAQDPVVPVADRIAEGATLLCFDEMQITDIADAMLVGRLFERLFFRGVVVVTTSNRHPDDLYRDGLNRQLFVPFIAMLKERLEVHHLDGGTDFRQARLRGMEVWHSPLGPAATAAMDAAWEALAGGPGAPHVLQLKGRELVIPRAMNGVARASFAALCEAPLGPADHLAIADRFGALILDDVPVMRRADNNAAKRFVTLIDALYEGEVRLICSAAAEPDALYADGEGAFEFQRTASRLEEMRSEGWGEG